MFSGLCLPSPVTRVTREKFHQINMYSLFSRCTLYRAAISLSEGVLLSENELNRKWGENHFNAWIIKFYYTKKRSEMQGKISWAFFPYEISNILTTRRHAAVRQHAKLLTAVSLTYTQLKTKVQIENALKQMMAIKVKVCSKCQS